MKLPFDRSCMHALADAAKALSLIDLLRWRFVGLTLVERGCSDTALERLLEQTIPLVDALTAISSIPNVEEERSFLENLR
jgi:hypothetical protein